MALGGAQNTNSRLAKASPASEIHFEDFYMHGLHMNIFSKYEWSTQF